jgi:hypothetical protein
MDLEQLEALALADDRSAALAELLPGTPGHDYWRGIHLQHRGQLDEVDGILSTWQRRHGGTDDSHARLKRRQLLLRAGKDLPRHADKLRFEAGLELNDEAEAVAAAQRNPSVLDPASLDQPVVVEAALGHSHELVYLSDWALPDLVDRKLDPTQRRHLLQRLTRANVPGTVQHIAADLGEKSSRGFGTLPIHAQLTRTQLDELARLRPELRKAPAWVTAVVLRLRPPGHVDWQTDPAARAAYLTALWAFVRPLPPAFNALKVQVLYHLLDLDRRHGRLDRARFLEYLALPRRVHYARSERLHDIPPNEQVGLGSDAGHGSGLPAVGDDEPLVREYLEHLLLTEDGAAVSDHLRADWLAEQLAVTRLLAGAGEADRWAALLGPARLAALRERVDLELTVRNPERVAADAAVTLEVDLKNVQSLVVKTFRIDAVAYWLARRSEVDTTVDLDGMVASSEQRITSDLPAIRRVRQRIPLPGCDRPGTYVIELIGNGKSSRALIRKGGLRHTVRLGVAGPTVRVLDDHHRPVKDARLWLGDREYTPRDDGAISIPFSTAPGRASALLVHGDIAQLEQLDHPAEHYNFSAGIHLERESLVPGKPARALLRPILSLAGWPAPIALLEDPRLDISVTDRSGTTSSKSQPIALHDDAETIVELHVPEDAAAISLAVRGNVRVVSTQQNLELADSVDAAINNIHATLHTEALHLAATDAGHVLHLLGKTGEPRPGRAVALTFKHVAITYELSLTLDTDARGRIELGHLAGLERVTASLPSGVQQTWSLWPDHAAPRVLHVVAGDPLVLPLPVGATKDNLVRALALLELRGGAPASDATAHVSVVDRTLRLASALGPGEYLLQARGAPDLRIHVAPADAPVVDGWVAAGPLALELSPPTPVLAALVADDTSISVRVADAGPHTRVHLIATRYLADPALPRTLHRPLRAPLAASVAPVRSHYVSGRDIGDEYRYVLERRGQKRRPGVLLDKPGLLLNPWAVRTTSNAVQHARGGGGYAQSPPRPGAPPPAGAAQLYAQANAAGAAFVSLDFLAAPAVVLANLRPDEHGVVRVPRGDLGPAQTVRAVVVDGALTSVADLRLPETDVRPRDLRLRLALAHDGHFSEERGVEGAPAGAVLVVEDTRSGKLEIVDTTARAYQILLSLGAHDPLREFGFLAQWHALDDATRRARYSKYACHELHLFLRFRDPAFFDRVVRPYLAHKRNKTFVDRWLLGDDLTAFLDPYAFGRLNALERVLLARRHPEVAPAIVRLLGDAVDLVPPDPERDARLVDTLLGATALEGDGLSAEPIMAHSLLEEESPEDDADEVAELSLDDAEESSYRSNSPAKTARAPREEAKSEDSFGGPRDAPSPDTTADKSVSLSRARSARIGRGDDLGPANIAADMKERSKSRPLYRGADNTQEWAESDWWHIRAASAHPGLIEANRFWRDLAAHDPAAGPFLSPHLGECISFSAAVCALAVLDLPFTAGAHAVVRDDTRLTVTAATPLLAARTRIAPVAPAADPAPILVGQSYFRADDRWAWDGSEQREKYVTGELLVGVVYQCQVVVTNPTSRHHKLAVLLQIPRGAVPVNTGFYTRTIHLHLGAYGTQALEYAFYFPVAGQWPHFPAHVTRAGALIAFADPTVLAVVREPTQVDDTSWAHISQHGATADVLAFLRSANLGRVDLARIAWRMKDRDAFTRVTALLDARRHYHDRLWAYALRHADPVRTQQWLRNQTDLLRGAGPVLERAVVDIDPVERVWYEHLEYAPLINARAHQLGARRQILNDALASQYRSFLDLVAHRAVPTADDRLAAAHYLFCLDRLDDALAALARVDANQLASPLQHAYLAAYAACCRGDLAAARALATPWQAHPVDRWRTRFAALIAMLDEAEGGAQKAALDQDSRDQRMDELAASQPALAVSVEHGAVVLQHHNLAACQLRFYRMDIELLFSRQPFVQGDVDRFGWIEPGAVTQVALTDNRTTAPIPDAMRGQNLVIEALAPGLRRSVAHYAHDLAPQLIPQYGQVRVLRAATQTPLPATYVKVYARQHGGAVTFYKDGYTDLRGRFDYVTLSTDDLDRVERFAILIASDDAGATVLEAPPPPR